MTVVDWREVARERDNFGISVFEAYHRVKQRDMLVAVEDAKTVDDLREIVLQLVLNTKFTSGGPRG